MKTFNRSSFVTVMGFLLSATLMPAQALRDDLSVIGSDGVIYLVTTPGIVPFTLAPKTSLSKLEAFNLNGNAQEPLDSLQFSGMATHLSIGRDNRLFLIVSPRFDPILLGSSVAGLDESVLVERPARAVATLFIIPTPFPARGPNATLESIATDANNNLPVNLNSVVKVELEGTVDFLKVKVVSDKEYLYILATSSTTPMTEEDPSLVQSRLLVLNSNGKRIKEVLLD